MFVLDTILLTAWGVCLGLIALYFIDAICYGVARSVRESTGHHIDEVALALLKGAYTAITGGINHVWVWGVCNPTWAWDVMEKVNPSPTARSMRYFQ